MNQHFHAVRSVIDRDSGAAVEHSADMGRPSAIECGAAAEAAAAGFLQARGLTVLARNLRCRAGELDLVCLEGDVLVIVEVRERARPDFGGALSSVTWRKRRKLILAAEFYWQRRPEWRARVLRFDVIASRGRPDGTREFAWVKDAFRVA